MNKFIQKDKKNRQVVNQFEKIRFVLKCIINNLNYSNLIRWNAVLKLTNLLKNSSQINLINRCILTGNKKRANKLYNYSRMVFLKLIRFGYINGIKKSAW